MQRSRIEPADFSFDMTTIGSRWLLLAAGNFAAGSFNAMTISWGSVGQIWNKPFFQVLVRPTRYTRGFMDSNDNFTLCVLPPEFKPALSIMGSKSGRDCDKVKEAGLTPIASSLVSAPGFAEAELIVECRKMYWQDIDPAHFLDPGIQANYPKLDYHRIYFGEIVALHGTNAWKRTKGA